MKGGPTFSGRGELSDQRVPQAGYGQNVPPLTLASAGLRKLLENVKVAGILKAGHVDIGAEFEKIAATEAW